jgi:hypothetical protein
MRKISKALLYPPGDSQQDARPRGVSGATITSGSGPQEIDLVALFAKPANQATIEGSGVTPDQSNPGDKPTGSSPDAGPVTFTTPNQFPVVATV